MRQSEFPIEQPVPVFDPTLVFLLVLAGLAVMALAFVAGRLTARGDKGEGRNQTPKIIHDAIRAKCVAASSAHSGELLAKTQDLIDEVRLRVGPLLAFGGPCGQAFGRLDKVMAGNRPELEKPDHGKHQGRHGHEPDHDHAAPSACRDDAGSASAKAGVEILSRNVTLVGSQTVVLAEPKPAPGDHHDHHHNDSPKPLDYKEHIQRLRLAVAEFSDFWNRKTCLDELRACQTALNETTPLSSRKAESVHP